MKRRFNSSHVSVLAGLTMLGALAGGSVLAQTTMRGLRLQNMVQYYSGLPHQQRAIALLQQQIDSTQPELLQADAIATNVWRNSQTLAGHVDVLSAITPADRTGADPLELAMSIVNASAGSPVEIELLTDGNTESPSQVMITMTQTALQDDSVEGIRHRFDIARQNGQWTVQRAGRQVRCRAGRGQQTWGAENCL